jgi:hypothetical protein
MFASHLSLEHVMTVRPAWLALASVLVLPIAGNAALAASSDTSAASRGAEERALRAQIDHMDNDLQALESQLYVLENDHSGTDPSLGAREEALRTQIHRMDRDQELIEDRLSELEKSDPPPLPTQATQPSTPAAVEMPPPASPPPQMTPSPMPPPAPPGPTLRRAADPAVYEKAARDRVSMFRYNPYRWVPVGTHQLAVYNTYNEAYLLDLSADCPGLLTTERITIESFSTQVFAGKNGVLAGDERCAITQIRELDVFRLP